MISSTGNQFHGNNSSFNANKKAESPIKKSDKKASIMSQEDKSFDEAITNIKNRYFTEGM